MKLRFTTQARRDLDGQLDWLADRSLAAFRKASDQIEQGFFRLLEFSESGSLRDEGFRETVIQFGKSGFVVRYRLTEKSIIIVAVFHGRQQR